MRNNYYDMKKKNMRSHHNVKRLVSTSSTPRYNKISQEERMQSNYRKRKAKKLNYKKVFGALLILFLICFFIIFGFSKLVSKIKRPKQAQSAAYVPQDTTVNMAVIR